MWYYWFVGGFVVGVGAAALFFRVNPKYLGDVEKLIAKLELAKVKERIKTEYDKVVK
jgi:uncharacterized membrane-anchored protein YhcB (DUF1043 family)